ncbi:hypothetical protein [Salisediminibacterium selenitireducens]|uniref:Uncharacterized protein n=1 Tax=Bacillus selenitireducens (strain ATCC 700615 / DSM 15326 / MLS10) TaxID=439292 RepID=D6Y1B4_BACIE|nr:hypothetical protein [Salisediminibacterium selenitireducens]ADI00701.1 hypothetical protein Bsel_3219 [[Bacillus] selenitireducens MLS10]
MKSKGLIVFGIVGLFAMNFMLITIYNVFTASDFDLSAAADHYVENEGQLSGITVDERVYWEGDRQAFSYLAHEGEVTVIFFKENLFGWTGEAHWLGASRLQEPVTLGDEGLVTGVMPDNRDGVTVNGREPDFVDVGERTVWVVDFEGEDFPETVDVNYEN